MGQPVVHFEFWSPEPEKAAEFYNEVLDPEQRAIGFYKPSEG